MLGVTGFVKIIFGYCHGSWVGNSLATIHASPNANNSDDNEGHN